MFIPLIKKVRKKSHNFFYYCCKIAWKIFFLLMSRKCVFSGCCAIRKNVFSRHWARKIMFCPWPQTKDAPNRSLPSSASPRTVIYVRFGPFFTFVAMGKNILFLRQRQENTWFRIVPRSENTCFLAADKKKKYNLYSQVDDRSKSLVHTFTNFFNVRVRVL